MPKHLKLLPVLEARLLAECISQQPVVHGAALESVPAPLFGAEAFSHHSEDVEDRLALLVEGQAVLLEIEVCEAEAGDILRREV